MVQQQINLIARIERAIAEPDPNQVRVVRGLITLQDSAVERFLRSQYRNPDFLCGSSGASPAEVSPFASNLSEPETQIYCSLYASSQQLLNLMPVLDRLLARRGELAPVGQLPLASGERPIYPAFNDSPVRRPDLGRPAPPFFAREPNLPPTAPPIIGATAKKPLAEYVPPTQPALVRPQEAIATLQVAKQLVAQARGAFPPATQFSDPTAKVVENERYTYDLEPEEPETYAKFLSLPNTGIFRVLPPQAYLRPRDTLQNRLQPSVAERYPFPLLAEGNGEFTPRLTLQAVNNNFQLAPEGINYGFMVDLGDVPLEKLDTSLKAVSPNIREFFLNYQPPRQLDALQVERRRFLTGKLENFNQSEKILGQLPAVVNHTYLVRSLQFQLPEIIVNGRPVSGRERRYLDQLLKIQSSDIIVAFRPVRRRSDGSYTILWRVVNQLSDPQINDLEEYVKLQ